MTLPDAQPPPLTQRDADFLLLVFRGFRAIAAAEQRTFRPEDDTAPIQSPEAAPGAA